MKLGRRWGCSPAAVRECTVREVRGMVATLLQEEADLEELEAERREQELATHYEEEQA